MSRIRIIIVEDEFVIREDMRAQLEGAGYEIVGAFDKAEDALPVAFETVPDILLIDIRLAGKMDGIHLAQSITQSLRVPIIFITANSDTATYERAKLTKPSAFLIKPFTTANLLASVDLALYHFSHNSIPDQIERPGTTNLEPAPFMIHRSLFIRAGGKYKKIKEGDIFFVEAAGSYVHIQTASDRFTLAQNLSQFQRKASLANLVRIHRSYIVNIEQVDSFEESHVYVHTHKLPLSENHRAQFLAQLRML
jgi:DNA-binding LytR/AlgR family response regulator